MIVAGFGFRASASTASLQDAFDRASACAEATHAATTHDKAEMDVFREFAARSGLQVLAIEPDRLQAQTTATQSLPSQAARKTGSVAEAAALAGAGEGAELVALRVVSGDGMATCAVARETG